MPEVLWQYELLVKKILAGCLAETVTMPFDTGKVLNQVNMKQSNPFKGILAGYARQAVYGGLRLSIYPEVINCAPDPSNIFYKMGAGLISGSLAITVASPTDLIKVRVQSGKSKNIRTSISQIHSRYGVAGFWIGWWPNVVRNSVINMAELVAFDVYKNDAKLSPKETVIGGALAGVAGTIVGGPVDMYKSRKMAEVPITRTDFTLSKMYRGLGFNLCRMVGFNVVLFSALEYFR